VADLKVRRASRLHRRKLLVCRIPLWPPRSRALRTLVRTELRPDLKSHYKKVVVRDVGEANPAALRKQLTGGLFQITVNLNHQKQALQESISEQVREVGPGVEVAVEGVEGLPSDDLQLRREIDAL